MSPKWRIAGIASSSFGVPLIPNTFSLNFGDVLKASKYSTATSRVSPVSE